MRLNKKYKKYIIFQYDDCYPTGGLGDITGSFDTIKDAVDYANAHREDNTEIVDRDTWEEVVYPMTTNT